MLKPCSPAPKVVWIRSAIQLAASDCHSFSAYRSGELGSARSGVPFSCDSPLTLPM